MFSVGVSVGRCLSGSVSLFDQFAFEHDLDLVADNEPSVQYRG